jgi:hypothetical protein
VLPYWQIVRWFCYRLYMSRVYHVFLSYSLIAQTVYTTHETISLKGLKMDQDICPYNSMHFSFTIDVLVERVAPQTRYLKSFIFLAPSSTSMPSVFAVCSAISF